MELFIQLSIVGIEVASIYILVALGFSIIYNTTHEFHIAHALSYTIASYTAYLIYAHLHTPFLTKLVFAFIGSFIATAIYGFFVNGIYMFLRIYHAPILQKFIFSLGLLITVTSIFEITFGVYSLQWGTTDISISLGSFIISYNYLILFILTTIIAILLILFLRNTNIGYQLRAVSSNIELSRNMGINIPRIYTLAYILGSTVVVPAAIVEAMETGSDPFTGLRITLVGILATLVSEGKYINVVLITLFLVLLENLSQMYIPSEWSWGFTLILALVIIFLRSLITTKKRKGEVIA